MESLRNLIIGKIFKLWFDMKLWNEKHILRSWAFTKLTLWELPADWSKWTCYHLMNQPDKVYHKNSLMCIPNCQSLILIGLINERFTVITNEKLG